MSWTDLPTCIDRGDAPGGLVFKHFADGETFLVQRLWPPYDGELAVLAAVFSREQAQLHVRKGCEVFLRIYDGDDGEMVITAPFDCAPGEWIRHRPIPS